MLSLVCLIFALVLFLVGAFLNPTFEPWKSRLGLIGLAFWVAAEIIAHTPLH